jgi:hypothetical protein
MREALPPDTILEISRDGGRTWAPLPSNYEQTGRLVRVDGDVAVQDVGRGNVVMYRVRKRTGDAIEHHAS